MEEQRRRWRDRDQAGHELAARFTGAARPGEGAVLVALPRGGVPVAAAMATDLGLPLVTWAVRKITHPAWPEVAIGAVAPGGVILWEATSRDVALLDEAQRRELAARQLRELERRRGVFGDPEPASLRDWPLIVVDDGIATGMTARAALVSLRHLQPASLTLAVPVVDRRVVPDLRRWLDRLEALAVVDGLRAVGEWYDRFEQLSDHQVLALLAAARRSVPPPGPGG